MPSLLRAEEITVGSSSRARGSSPSSRLERRGPRRLLGERPPKWLQDPGASSIPLAGKPSLRWVLGECSRTILEGRLRARVCEDGNAAILAGLRNGLAVMARHSAGCRWGTTRQGARSARASTVRCAARERENRMSATLTQADHQVEVGHQRASQGFGPMRKSDYPDRKLPIPVNRMDLDRRANRPESREGCQASLVPRSSCQSIRAL